MAGPTVSNNNPQPKLPDLGVFTEIYKPNSDQIVILNSDGTVTFGGKVGYSNWLNRKKGNEDDNNRTRTALLEALCKMYDVDINATDLESRLKGRMPKAVFDALKFSKFDVSNGKATSGRPLSQRRITLVSEAIRQESINKGETIYKKSRRECEARDIVERRFADAQITADAVKKWDPAFLVREIEGKMVFVRSCDDSTTFSILEDLKSYCAIICNPDVSAIDREKAINAVNDLLNKYENKVKFKEYFKLNLGFVLKCMGEVRKQYDDAVKKRAEDLNKAANQLTDPNPNAVSNVKVFDFETERQKAKNTFADINNKLARAASKLSVKISNKVNDVLDSIGELAKKLGVKKPERMVANKNDFCRSGLCPLEWTGKEIGSIPPDSDTIEVENYDNFGLHKNEKLVSDWLIDFLEIVSNRLQDDKQREDLLEKYPNALQTLTDLKESLELVLVFRNAFFARSDKLPYLFMEKLSCCISNLKGERVVSPELPKYCGKPNTGSLDVNEAFVNALRKNPRFTVGETFRNCLDLSKDLATLLREIFAEENGDKALQQTFAKILASRLNINDKDKEIGSAIVKYFRTCKEGPALSGLCETLMKDMKLKSDDKLELLISEAIIELARSSTGDDKKSQDKMIIENGGGLIMVNEREFEFTEGGRTFCSTTKPRQQVEHENNMQGQMSRGLTNLARTTLEVVEKDGETKDGTKKKPILTMLRFGCVGTTTLEHIKNHYRQLAEQVFLASPKLKKMAKEDGESEITVPIFRTDLAENNNLNETMVKFELNEEKVKLELNEEKVKLEPFVLKFQNDEGKEVKVAIKPEVSHFYAPTDTKLKTSKSNGNHLLFESAKLMSNNKIVNNLCAEAKKFAASEDCDEKTKNVIAVLTNQLEDFMETLKKCTDEKGNVIAELLEKETENLDYGPLMQRFGARVTVLAAMMEYVPAINCNWGCDRTSAMDSECKTLASQIHEATEDKFEIPSITAPLTEEEIELRNQMLEKTGNADLARQTYLKGSPISLNQHPRSGFSNLFGIDPKEKKSVEQAD